MSRLQTVRMKPNPAGKDRSRYGASAAQLAAEWVDIKNVSGGAVDLTGVRLCHIAYSNAHPNGRWEQIIAFTGTLQPGQVIRVHAGSRANESQIRYEDLVGADFHLFSGRDEYVWNNDRGDCSSLWTASGDQPFDKACYASPPAEGAILTRVGDALVEATHASASARR